VRERARAAHAAPSEPRFLDPLLALFASLLALELERFGCVGFCDADVAPIVVLDRPAMIGAELSVWRAHERTKPRSTSSRTALDLSSS
jgi:hypothetical protein